MYQQTLEESIAGLEATWRFFSGVPRRVILDNFPAVAANAYHDAFPETTAIVNACPTTPADERDGWPPLPGDYSILRYAAPVAPATPR